MTGCDRPFQRQLFSSVISGLRWRVVGWVGTSIGKPPHRRPRYRATGHRLPAWLRPGTKWPPGKSWLPLPHLVLGRLGEGHVVSCDGVHPLVSAAWPSVPTGARSDPRNQRRWYRRLPPSPFLLTSRLVGRRTYPAPGLTSHLDYSALSQALLTMRRPVSIRHFRSEAVGHGTMVGRSSRSLVQSYQRGIGRPSSFLPPRRAAAPATTRGTLWPWRGPWT